MALALAREAPRAVTLDADEVHRVVRARVALLLHVPPGAVDALPLRDVYDVLAVAGMHQEV